MTATMTPPSADTIESSTRSRMQRFNPRIRRTLLTTAGVFAVAIVWAGLSAGSGTVLIQALVTGILTGGIYSLVAMGLTLVYGVLHIINFANGAMVGLAMYLTLTFVNGTGMHPYLALIVVIPVMIVFGALVQGVLLNPVMRAPLQNQLLITIGIALAVENILLLIYGPNPQSVALPGNRAVHFFGAAIELSRIYALIGSMVLVALLWLVLQKTRTGIAVRAVAANPEGARLVGISIKRIYVLTFAIGAAASGAAGVLVTPFSTIEPTAGSVFNLTAFVVVVLGGMGNVPGALVGGFVVGLTEQLGSLILPGQSSLLVVFIVFLVVLFARPTGVFGRAS